MTWARRPNREFNIDMSINPKCGGEARVIACVKDQKIINKILNHLQAKGALLPPPDLLTVAWVSPYVIGFVESKESLVTF
jgi:hypothetical protein